MISIPPTNYYKDYLVNIYIFKISIPPTNYWKDNQVNTCNFTDRFNCLVYKIMITENCRKLQTLTVECFEVELKIHLMQIALIFCLLSID